MNIVLVGIGVFLFAVLVVGMIGIATTEAPGTGASLVYGADGSSWVNPPHLATLWLVITLMDVVAILAFGIFTAAQNQQ